MANSLSELFGKDKEKQYNSLSEMFGKPSSFSVKPLKPPTLTPLAMQMKPSHTPVKPIEPEASSTWDKIKVGDIKGLAREVGIGLNAGIAQGEAVKQNKEVANILANNPFMSKVGQNQLADIQRQEEFTRANPVNSVPAILGKELTNLPLWMAGEGVANLAGKGISKLLPSFAQKAANAPKFIKGGVRDATAYGTTVSPVESYREGENFSEFLEREKGIPAVFLGGAAIRGIGAGAKLSKDAIGEGGSFRQALALRKLNTPELVSNPLADVQNAYKAPSLRDIKTRQYEELFSSGAKPMVTQQPINIRQPIARQGMTEAELAAQRMIDAQSSFGGSLNNFKLKQRITPQQQAYEARQAELESVFQDLPIGSVDTPMARRTLQEGIDTNLGINRPKGEYQGLDAFGKSLKSYSNSLQRDIAEIESRMAEIEQGASDTAKQIGSGGNESIRKAIKDKGGIKFDSGNADISEEMRVIPAWLRNKNGLPLDQMADELGMTSNELLTAIGSSTKKVDSGTWDMFNLLNNDAEYKALSQTLETLNGQLPGKKTLSVGKDEIKLKPRELTPKPEQKPIQPQRLGLSGTLPDNAPIQPPIRPNVPIKPRELKAPRPMESIPTQRVLPEKPEPLRWTNKDPLAGPLPTRSVTPNNLGQLPGRNNPQSPLSRTIETPIQPAMAEVKAHPVADKIVSKLDDIEASARARIQASKGRLNAGLPVDTLVDYGIIGAVKIAKGTVKYTTWAADMVKDFGDDIKPHLKDVWKESRKQHALMLDGTFSHETAIDPSKIKDIGNFKAYTTDVYRIMRDALGKEAGNDFTKPLDMAKDANVDMQLNLTNKLKTDIVDGLGIKKGSKESALVQRYGEGKITLEELKQASPKKWQDIVQADKWFRKEYDQLIDQVNASKRQIYPNAEDNIAKAEAKIAEARANKKLSATERSELIKELEVRRENAMRGKIIPKRNDYYRHFQEMAEGVQGLKNIFDSPANISTQLIGRSEFSAPRSKWASFAQKRVGDKTEEDAVGGFLNYIPSASYATHIDPQVARLREFTQVLRDTTADSHNADTFIGFLDKYTNDLAGKTNPADRLIQDIIPGGRKTFAALTWLNNRVKANVILGKFGSMLAQLANVPNGVAYGKQYAFPGLINSVKSIADKNAISKSSPFLKERFLDSSYRVFDEKLLQQPKKLAVYMMETADKVGTTFIWNTAYAKGVAQRVEDPIRYADMATRDLVAGRGIGEVPILQKSKVFQLVAPFQLEVANLWHVQKDFLKANDFGGLMSLFLLNYAFNELMINTRGSKVTFDPIRAVEDAVTTKNISPLQRAGRLGGEVISNFPLGQTIASMYPEYGTENLPSRKALFGANDPTRFGSSVLLAKAAQDPISKLALPFGGEQVKKTLNAVSDLSNGGHFASSGKLSYPVSPTPSNIIKGTLFGPGAFNEARPYYDNNLRPLSKTQTNEVLQSPDQYNVIQTQRQIDSLDRKISDVEKDDDLTKAEKAKKLMYLKAQLAEIERGR